MCERKCMARRMLACLLVFFLAFSTAFSYADVESNAAAKRKVTSIKIAKKSATLEVGKTKTFKVKVKGSKGVAKRFKAKSANKKIAKVKVSGTKIKITGVKKGKTTITVTTKDRNKKGKKLKAKIKIKVKKASTTVQPTAPPTEKPEDKPVIANGIVLSSATLNLKKGESAKLTAELKPANTTDKSLEWTSSDAKIASVDKDGNVSALKRGDAVIAVSNKASGLKATCSVNVKTIVTVSTQAELDAALAEGADELTVNTGSDKLIIPEGKYDYCTLFIKGTGEVENNGTFKDVVIAGTGTYTENAANNINVQAPAVIDIGSNGNAGITVNLPSSDADKEIKINNSGAVSELDIVTAAKVRLEGDSGKNSPVNVNISADNVSLVTDHQANVVANKKTELTFTGNTNDTRVTVEDKSQTPVIRGVGFIEVTYSSTGEKVVIAAEPIDGLGDVDITGLVKSLYDYSVMSDVTIKVIPFNKYKAGETVSDEDITASATTDSKGTYKLEKVSVGNYCIVFEKDSFLNSVQYIAAADSCGSEYANETMYMIPDRNYVIDNSDAKLSGVVKDASSGTPVEGLTVELKLYKGNVIDKALYSTRTDSDGKYEFSGLEGQQYSIYVKDERDADEKYISKFENVSIYPSKETEKNIVISKPVKGKGVKFVLTWAGNVGPNVPYDLDMHLFGPSTTGLVDYFHVNKYDKQYGQGNVIYSSLDANVTKYNGPETVNIVEPVDGVYHLYVLNFSAADSNAKYSFKNSEAKVDIYSGGQLLTTINVPGFANDIWWYVCSYDSVTGTIESKNLSMRNAEINGEYIRYGFNGNINEVTILSEVGGVYTYLEDIKNIEGYSIASCSYNGATGIVDNGKVILYSLASKEDTIDKVRFVTEEGYTTELKTAVSDDPSYVGVLSIYDADGNLVDIYDVYYEVPFMAILEFPKAFKISNDFVNHNSITVYTEQPVIETELDDIKITFTDPEVTAEYDEIHTTGTDVTSIDYRYYRDGKWNYFKVYVVSGVFVEEITRSGKKVEFSESSNALSFIVQDVPENGLAYFLDCEVTCLSDEYTGAIINDSYTINGLTHNKYILRIKKGDEIVVDKMLGYSLPG
ncbi:MAG: Ig-like domain-containing protein [Eubacterium sp.]|nr:Ig-like domain-containing protein [Eubacterium sp.]